MAWSPKTPAVNGTGTANTSIAVTSAVSVAVGDVIVVWLNYARNGVVASSVMTDQLGNAYTLINGVRDTTNDQALEGWYSKITVGGTPTITAKYNPTPGTTQALNAAMNVEPYTGSDANSATDGSNAHWDTSSNTSTDGEGSGTYATTVDGDLIVSAIQTADHANNAAGNAGTGFTLNSDSSFAGGVVRTRGEYMVQTTHSASTQGTWTGTTAGENMQVVSFAITPAGGAAAVSDEGQIWTDVWKAAKPYVPIVTVYN